MTIAVESLILAAVCMFDLVSTVWLLRTGVAVEANPILKYYLDNGSLVSFAGVKILLTIGPLFAIEAYRRHRPVFFRRLLRIAIISYIILYGLGCLWVNDRPYRSIQRLETAFIIH